MDSIFHHIIGDDANVHHTIDDTYTDPGVHFGNDAGFQHSMVDHHADHGVNFDPAHDGFTPTDPIGIHSDVPWLNFGPPHNLAEFGHGDSLAHEAHDNATQTVGIGFEGSHSPETITATEVHLPAENVYNIVGSHSHETIAVTEVPTPTPMVVEQII